MLKSLHISNYALIDSVDITLYPGLNIITGETGAGKSIMLSALGLLLGGRADLRSVRRADARSVIECEFDVTGMDALAEYCRANDIEWDPAACIIRREISPTGRSRSFINDSPVTLDALREVGNRLVDIHSQHQNLLLSSADFQRSIIDSIAGNEERYGAYGELYGAFREALRRLKALKASIARDRDNEEFMRFQLAGLDDLNLQEGELAQLEQEAEEMGSAAETKSYVTEALEALSEGEVSAVSLIERVSGACADLADHLPEGDDIRARLDSVTIELNDIADTLGDLNDRLTASPADLEAVNARIDAIRLQMRRHHADDEAQLLAIHRKLRRRVEQLADADTLVAEADREARAAHRKAVEAAREISEARRKAADEFAGRLMQAAMPLGMKNLRIVIDITPADISATGIDNVEFRFAFNKNQEPIPVGGAASGGEISRLMLSIKAIIADRMALPSIVFDEVDTGVSGDVASRMGAMMQQIGRSIQVIAITHLPQVAARGAHQFKVYKADDDVATHTHITELSADERIGELALMLSGDAANEAARATAATLLDQASSAS